MRRGDGWEEVCGTPELEPIEDRPPEPKPKPEPPPPETPEEK
jgi:hypothetical protein